MKWFYQFSGSKKTKCFVTYVSELRKLQPGILLKGDFRLINQPSLSTISENFNVKSHNRNCIKMLSIHKKSKFTVYVGHGLHFVIQNTIQCNQTERTVVFTHYTHTYIHTHFYTYFYTHFYTHFYTYIHTSWLITIIKWPTNKSLILFNDHKVNEKLNNKANQNWLTEIFQSYSKIM